MNFINFNSKLIVLSMAIINNSSLSIFSGISCTMRFEEGNKSGQLKSYYTQIYQNAVISDKNAVSYVRIKAEQAQIYTILYKI